MDPARFTFEVSPLYKSLAYDAFSTLEALEHKPCNSWFVELMGTAAKRFAPHGSELTSDIKAQNFVRGALAVLEAYNDTVLEHETRRRTNSTVARKVLLLATAPQPPDIAYRDFSHRAREGFTAHTELKEGGNIIVAHLVERWGDTGLAEAGRVGVGFAGQLLGVTCQSFLVHPAVGIDADRVCAEAMTNFDARLEQWLASGETPPAQS